MRLIRQEKPNQGGEANWAGALLAGARKAVEWQEQDGPISGYVLLAFYADGSTWASHRWGNESPINRCALPQFIAEVLRRDVITGKEAQEVFDEMFECR